MQDRPSSDSVFISGLTSNAFQYRLSRYVVAHQKTSILVTGANGFIGSYLAQAIAARGEKVKASIRTAVGPSNLPNISSSRLAVSVRIRSGLTHCKMSRRLSTSPQLVGALDGAGSRPSKIITSLIRQERSGWQYKQLRAG